MVNVFDVAYYILEKCGSMSAMKLQKLVFYSQAWSLVWDDKPLFNEQIEAWSNGPVVKDLYDVHKGMFELSSEIFKSRLSGKSITEDQKETINTVVEFYGKKSAQWLSDQTHSEAPWKTARIGLSDNERGNEIVTLESMAEYYGSL